LENKEWLATKKTAKWHKPHPHNNRGEEGATDRFRGKVSEQLIKMAGRSLKARDCQCRKIVILQGKLTVLVIKVIINTV
jgi:hypothetical protein